MSGRRNKIMGTIDLLVAAGAIAAATLALADGRITVGIITLLCATACAITGTANLSIAARLRVLDNLAAKAEQRSAHFHAAFAEAALASRRAGDHITMRDLLAAVERWALIYETEKIGGASDEHAIAAAFAATIAHERKATR